MKKLRHDVARRDHYEELTNTIIAKLEEGVLPWRRPWDPRKCSASGSPMNPVTGRSYRGINALALAMSPRAFGRDPRWMSYRQAAARGWQVRKGERQAHRLAVLDGARLLSPDLGAVRPPRRAWASRASCPIRSRRRSSTAGSRSSSTSMSRCPRRSASSTAVRANAAQGAHGARFHRAPIAGAARRRGLIQTDGLDFGSGQSPWLRDAARLHCAGRTNGR